MSTESIHRPELKEPVLKLIERVHTSHQLADVFELSATDLLALAGLNLDEDNMNLLRSRSSVKFTPFPSIDLPGGGFVNEGPKHEFKTEDGLTIIVPERLGGHYTTTNNLLELHFNDGETLRGCKRVIVRVCQDIQKITATDHQLKIDLPGERFDVVFTF